MNHERPLVLLDLLTGVHVHVFLFYSFDGPDEPEGVTAVHLTASSVCWCGVTSWLNLICDVNPRPSQAAPNGFVLFVADPHDTSLSLVFTAGAHYRL